ncbi:MAG: DUF1735 domain-containing protein [Bacteroidales bacterium]|nr:DUF1735 domain-containing protein [Bacteroidales bacterium]MDE7128174.1 DUF1735 domain-containing protein [Bacteroidales bacterium]
MKINIKRFILPAIALLALAGCADWLKPESVKIGNYDLTVTDKDNAYYQALRDYKASKHEISFGWYSRWDEPALTTDGMLMGIPDSMDVVSLWSSALNLSAARKEDLRFVQQVKGTKVVMCTFCQYVGKGFTPAEYDESEEKREQFWGWVDGDNDAIESAIAKYAKAINDTIVAYGYDGLDIDYEPNIDGVKGKLDENSTYFTMLCNELSKYIGPKSGTGRLFIIDGEIYNLPAELCTCFDYFVAQAYAVSGGTPSPTATGSESNMDYRLSQVVSRYSAYMTEEEVTNRFVVTENMESALDALNGGFYWQTRDGVTQDKKKIPSMLGMAMWQPANGFRKGGFGGYRFDNEATNDPAYKWMRKGIQAQNPAEGTYSSSVRFSSSAEVEYSVECDESGNLMNDMLEDVFNFTFTRRSKGEATFALSYESGLVDGYNAANGTSFIALDASRISLDGVNVNDDATSSENAVVSIDLKGLEKGKYMVPVKATLPEESYWTSDDELVRYIKINITFNNVVTDATEMTGVKIEPSSDWRVCCYNGINTSGWTGVWNNDSEAQQKAMFDERLVGVDASATYWYSISSYFNPGSVIYEMDRAYEVGGIRWHCCYGSEYDQFAFSDIQVSDDRVNWESISNKTSFTPVICEDLWINVPFKSPVTAKYIRIIVATSYYVSMDEAEVWAFAE